MKTGIFFLSALVLAGCSAENSVVGGRCAEGFAVSNGACTALVGSATDSSEPNRFGDGTATAPSTSTDEGGNVVGTGSAGSSGGAFGEGPTGTSSSPIIAGDPAADPVGQSPGETEVPKPLACDAPLVACHDACIPVASDGNNCGACGKICPSNICIDGECQGALAGDVIVLGHEYSSSWSTSAEAKTIANALSIATTDPIRVLSFDGDDAAAATERALITSTIRFRGVAFDSATDASLEALDLAKKYDVVLVHNAGTNASYLGARSRMALETFTKKGGIVVALDDGSSDIPAFVTNAGLLSIEGHQPLATGTRFLVTAPNDAVGVQVLSPYAANGASVGFVGVSANSDVTVVTRSNDDAALPTALHRFVR